ncbi:3-deoxy-manno-octulosonate cytidylyltransferase [Simkania negevensis]|uniref:3-deoxy-manno-octulosonate cytidylyltransferase n=1 Tax=Simkania negevensis TaxID=83561 RepID=A0ABS3ARI1_9BACT|nr:3-deoxy-manno-octulosonate cytidylyltransferase [Simkania negevensis]
MKVSKKMTKKFACVIPARYASTRFPGKPLHKILGKTLIQWTYESASRCSFLNAIVVATDDKRIYDHVIDFGGQAVMTSVDCINGTERIAEAVATSPILANQQYILNIQGDEPCTAPHTLKNIADVLIADDDAVVSTGVVPLSSMEEALDPSVVKCVFNSHGRALYFSRNPIPFNATENAPSSLYRHLGIYCYRRDFLLHYPSLPETPLQQAENLEQLKILEHGYPLSIAVVPGEIGIGVNTFEDAKKVENILCLQNTSSSPVG